MSIQSFSHDPELFRNSKGSKGPNGFYDLKKFEKTKQHPEMAKYGNLFDLVLSKLNLKINSLKPLFSSGAFGKLKLNFYFSQKNVQIEILNNWFYVSPILDHMFVFNLKYIPNQPNSSVFDSILSTTTTQIFSSKDDALLNQISLDLARNCSCQLQKVIFVATPFKTLLFPLAFLKHLNPSSPSCNLFSLISYSHDDVDKLYDDSFLNSSSSSSSSSSSPDINFTQSLPRSVRSFAFVPPSKDHSKLLQFSNSFSIKFEESLSSLDQLTKQ
jgi:hypothetical protein